MRKLINSQFKNKLIKMFMLCHQYQTTVPHERKITESHLYLVDNSQIDNLEMNYQTQNNWSGLEIFLLRIMLTSVSCWCLWMCISVFHKSNVSRTARIGLLMDKKQPETRCLTSLSTLNGPASQHSGRVRLLLGWVAVKEDRV